MKQLPSQNWEGWLYKIGCPVWNCKHWVGEVYPQGTSSTSILAWYSRMFNTVEGNSTFYGLPSLATVKNWCEQTPEGFTFSMKFPREISHDCMLVRCDSALRKFMDVLTVLRDHDRLGPTFLQLGPSFSFQYWERLQHFTESLPKHLPWAVEVRHADWFDSGVHEETLDKHLGSLGIDRVLFDARPLFSRPGADVSEREAQRRKPDSPYRNTVTGKRPMLRLIGLNDATPVLPWWEEWASIIAGWIKAGLEPWIFTHAPDDTHAPKLARCLHALVREKMEVLNKDLVPPELPQIPVARKTNVSQLSLFDTMD